MDDCHTFQLNSQDGTALHARHWSAPKPVATLALVHGFGEHSERYQPLADYLTARGVQVVAIDLRGHGRSGGKRGVIHSYDDFRADLHVLLTKARALHADVSGPLILFGHSMGGEVVLDHGLSEAPNIDAIIASAPLVALAEPIPGPLEALVRLFAKIMPKGGLKQPIDGAKVSTLEDEQVKYVDDPLNHGRMSFRLAVSLIDIGKALQDKAANWSVPLLVYHSDQDVLTDFEASRSFTAKAGGDFRTYTDVAHEMHNDTSRADVYAMIGDFIDQVAKRD